MLHVSNVYSRSSAAQLHPTLCDSMDCNTPSLSVHHQLPQLAQTHESVMPSNHLILCSPFLLLPSIFPRNSVPANESVLHIRWPKYWSFNFSINPSSEYSGLISLKIDWLDLLVVQGTLKSLLQHHSSRASILQPATFFVVQLSHSYMTNRKTKVLLTSLTIALYIFLYQSCSAHILLNFSYFFLKLF